MKRCRPSSRLVLLSDIYTFTTLLLSVQIMREIQEHKIKIYEFPETDDEEENRLVKKIKVCLFFMLKLMSLHIFTCTQQEK